MGGFRVTVRNGAKFSQERAEDVTDAMDLIERRGRRLQAGASAGGVGGTLIRRYEPVQRVIGRIELRGPRRLRAGVDVRGDGSAEAFVGRVRRTLVVQREGESPYDALRRELAGESQRGAPAPFETPRSRVPLPRGAEPPFRVFVSGVPQTEGEDYEVGEGELVFNRQLVKEKVGFWRWTAMFFALFGSYGRNDTVDVQYTLGDRRQLATGLDFVSGAEPGG